ncbi:dimer_Tnp_hAT domain-containing protein [Trichonephila clavipes]|nr:dimer_Tnp_hAT domain-containing protein [Trichonephila clavipes]
MRKETQIFERMSPRERFRAGVFLPIIDNIVAQLNKRRDFYEVLNTRFEIFRNLDEKKQEVTKQVKYLAQSYPKDIDEEQPFKMYMKVEKVTTRGIFTYVKKSKLESTFPNLEVEMSIYLTLPVTNCTTERIFSALKRIKTELLWKMKSLIV